MCEVMPDSLCICAAAFRSGAVMGFLLAGLGLLVIYITIQIFFLVCSSAAHSACITHFSASPKHAPSWSAQQQALLKGLSAGCS